MLAELEAVKVRSESSDFFGSAKLKQGQGNTGAAAKRQTFGDVDVLQPTHRRGAS